MRPMRASRWSVGWPAVARIRILMTRAKTRRLSAPQADAAGDDVDGVANVVAGLGDAHGLGLAAEDGVGVGGHDLADAVEPDDELGGCHGGGNVLAGFLEAIVRAGEQGAAEDDAVADGEDGGGGEEGGADVDEGVVLVVGDFGALAGDGELGGEFDGDDAASAGAGAEDGELAGPIVDAAAGEGFAERFSAAGAGDAADKVVDAGEVGGAGVVDGFDEGVFGGGRWGKCAGVGRRGGGRGLGAAGCGRQHECEQHCGVDGGEPWHRRCPNPLPEMGGIGA